MVRRKADRMSVSTERPSRSLTSRAPGSPHQPVRPAAVRPSGRVLLAAGVAGRGWTDDEVAFNAPCRARPCGRRLPPCSTDASTSRSRSRPRATGSPLDTTYAGIRLTGEGPPALRVPVIPHASLKPCQIGGKPEWVQPLPIVGRRGGSGNKATVDVDG